MVATAEADERVAMLPVLLASRPEPVGVVAIGVGEDFGESVGQRGRHHRESARGRHVSADVEVTQDLPHQHDQRRVHALGFLDAAFEHRQVPQ